MSTLLLAAILLGGQSGDRAVQVNIAFNGEPDEAIVVRAGGQVLLRSASLLSARIPAGRLADLARDPGIAFIDEDSEVKAAGSAPRSGPWNISRIGADLAWPTSTGSGIRIAVIDTGIDNTHPAFRDASGASRVTLGPCYVGGVKSAVDDHGHGSWVAGIAGASNAFNGATGVVGVAPDCRFTAIKALSRRGYGRSSAIAAGVDWAADHGCQVVNMSLGGPVGDRSLERAINRAVAIGVVVCAAAGESALVDEPLYPAAYVNCIAVTATDGNNQAVSWCDRADYIDIAAPGISIVSTWMSGQYAVASGTSAACPHVAGAAALLKATGLASVAEIRARLLGTADDVNAATWPGPDPEIGHGLVDVEEAVTGVRTHP